MRLRAVLIGFVLWFASGGVALATCTGQFLANQVCGTGASAGIPGPINATSALILAPGGTVIGNNSSSSTPAAASALINPILGIPGSSTGTLGLAGSTSGTVTITPQTTAGTPTLTLPNTTGTLADGASTPLVLNASTGNLTCPTCLTGGGGALTASAPLNIMSSNISLQGGNGTVAAGSGGTGSTFTATPSLGVAGTTLGTLSFANLTSGSETIEPATGALGSGISTLPAGTYNIVGDTLSQALTNKTYNGLTVTSTTGTLTITSGKTLTDTSAVGSSILLGATGGGFAAYAGVTGIAHEWISALSPAGVATQTQPAFTDISGQATFAQLPSVNADNVVGNPTGALATPTNVPLVNCASALIYSTSTHTFGCNSGLGTGTVTQVNSGSGIVGGPITTTGTLAIQQMIPGGRLTLTSGTPITTTDVTGATTIYYAPLNSEYVPIYNGTTQQLYQFTSSTTDTVGLSVTLGSNWASGNAYDWFVGLNGSTVTLCSGPAWTSAAAGSSSRGTGAGTTQLAIYDGVWTNAVSLTCNYSNTQSFTCAINQCTYVGSSLMTAAGATTDSAAERYVFNLYNQAERKLASPVITGSWTYTLTTWRQADASTANQASLFMGMPGSLANLRVDASGDTSAGGSFVAVGIGINSTNTDSADTHQTTTCTNRCPISASLRAFPGLGLQNYVWLEAAGVASGTNNYYGQASGSGIVYVQSAITGSVLM